MSQLPCSFLLIRVECLSSRAQAHAQDQGNLPGNGQVPGNHHDDDHHHHPMQIPSNVSAPVLISVDSCRMSQLPCSFPMPMQIPSNVSAPVLISADLCRMSQLPCSGSGSGSSSGSASSPPPPLYHHHLSCACAPPSTTVLFSPSLLLPPSSFLLTPPSLLHPLPFQTFSVTLCLRLSAPKRDTLPP